MHIVEHPRVLLALNPYYAVNFFMLDGWIAFLALGSVVLAVTGGEALYADMGHFGRIPIRVAWFVLVLPALVINYFGQGALHHPAPGRGRQSALPHGAGMGRRCRWWSSPRRRPSSPRRRSSPARSR